MTKLYYVTLKSEPDDTTWGRWLMPSLDHYSDVVAAIQKPYLLLFEELNGDARLALNDDRSWRVRASNEPRFSIVIVPVDLDGAVAI